LQEGRTTGVFPPLLGVLLEDPGVLLFPLLGVFPFEGPLFPGLLFGLLFGLLEIGPFDGPLLGPLLGMLGPLDGPLLGPLFPGLPGLFPLLLFPGVFEGGVVVGGGTPGTPRPFKDESNICSRERLVTT
jgi:hypothetical protein